MGTQVKICGLSTSATVDAAVQAGADFIGFVFFPKSPRNISVAEAASLAHQARGKAQVVALCVDPDDALLETITTQLKPGIIQLHGHESPERTRAIHALTGISLWKAMPVSSLADIEAAKPYNGIADRVLFDARPPAGATRPGGNAQAFDWGLLKDLDRSHPFVLSGGLTVGNVREAIRVTGAPCVDVSSGVETSPGEKDAQLIRDFIQAVRTFQP
jgi:phosphoribosylanthranilate isomerase